MKLNKTDKEAADDYVDDQRKDKCLNESWKSLVGFDNDFRRAFLAGVSHERDKYRERVKDAQDIARELARDLCGPDTKRSYLRVYDLSEALARLQDLENYEEDN